MLKGTRSLGLQLLCLLVFASFACSYKSGPADGGLLTGNKKDVEVTWNGSAVVCDPDPVRVETKKDRVVWASDHEMKIELPKSYDQPTCMQNGQKWTCTSKTFPKKDRVKYDAVLKVNGDWKRVDPLIEVEP